MILLNTTGTPMARACEPDRLERELPVRQLRQVARRHLPRGHRRPSGWRATTDDDVNFSISRGDINRTVDFGLKRPVRLVNVGGAERIGIGVPRARVVVARREDHTDRSGALDWHEWLFARDSSYRFDCRAGDERERRPVALADRTGERAEGPVRDRSVPSLMRVEKLSCFGVSLAPKSIGRRSRRRAICPSRPAGGRGDRPRGADRRSGWPRVP